MNNRNASLSRLVVPFRRVARRLRRYSLFAFIVFVIGLYGFVLLRINELAGTEPTTEAVSQQVKAAKVPRIDEAVVRQLQSLQDNSVSVQALFDQARSNPFQ